MYDSTSFVNVPVLFSKDYLMILSTLDFGSHQLSPKDTLTCPRCLSHPPVEEDAQVNHFAMCYSVCCR